jgi:drug/metabolite transporter (DMT)-like permease
MANQNSLQHTAGGIAFMCAGVASLCVNDAMAKLLTAHYSPLQILFMRNVIALPLAIALTIAMSGVPALRSHRPLAHLLRGFLWIAATMFFFTSLMHLGLAEATAIIFVAPLFITAISAIFLREHVGWRRWLAVLIGFAGVLIVVRPGGAAFQPAALLPVGAAIVYAVLMISSRFVDTRETVWTLLLWLTGTGAFLSAFIVPFVWVPLRAEDIWLFLGVAVFGTAGMTMMSQAFRMAPAAVVAPLDYTALIWATGLGFLIWGDVPDLATYLGAAVIIASGIYVILRESRVKG